MDIKKTLPILFLILSACFVNAETRIVQTIDILNSYITTTSTTWTPTEGSMGMINLNLSDYDGTVRVYLEVVGDYDYSGIPDGVGSGTVRLYDNTTNQNVTNSDIALSNYVQRRRSPDISSYFTTPRIIYPQIKVGSSGTDTVKVQAIRIIIIQNGTNITKTATWIPIGASVTSTASDAINPLPEIAQPKRWMYTSSDYEGTVSVYYAATLKTSNVLRYAKSSMLDLTDGETEYPALGLSTTNLNETWVMSSAITPTSGEEYTSTLARASSGVATATMRNSFLIIKQTNMNQSGSKLKSVLQIDNTYHEVASMAYNPTFPSVINWYNTSEWEQTTTNFSAEYVVAVKNSLLNVSVNLTDNKQNINNSGVTSKNTAWTRIRSGQIQLIGVTSIIDRIIHGNTTLYRYNISSSRLIQTIYDINKISITCNPDNIGNYNINNINCLENQTITTMKGNLTLNNGTLTLINANITLNSTNQYITLYPPSTIIIMQNSKIGK